MKTNKIYQGDCLEVLKTFPDESIDCIVTSPPYWNLRDYGTGIWEGGETSCDHVANPLATKKYGNPEFNKNRPSREETKTKGYYEDICPKCGAKRIDKQMGLESTFEEYINNLGAIFDEIKRVLRTHGTCWVNMGDTYSGNKIGNTLGTGKGALKQKEGITKQSFIKQIPDKIREKSLCMIPERFAIGMVKRGWILRNQIIWHKPNCMPSSIKDRFTVDFEKLFFFVKNKKYYFETQTEPQLELSKKRYQYNFSGNPGSIYPSENRNKPHSFKGDRMVEGGRNKRAVWKICPQPYSEAHFAVYPEELIETPIKAGCPEGGIVLDPFFGSGTTGVVALKQSKKFIGIELNQEYINIAEKRLKPYLEQTNLKEY